MICQANKAKHACYLSEYMCFVMILLLQISKFEFGFAPKYSNDLTMTHKSIFHIYFLVVTKMLNKTVNRSNASN